MNQGIAHVSIDLETMGLSADSVILAIGAAFVHPETNEVHSFVTPVQMASQSRKIDPGTQDWWEKQSAEAKAAVLDPAASPDSPHLDEALARLNAWFAGIPGEHGLKPQPWGNGAAFDLGMLNHAYAQCGMKAPWFYRIERDQRTLEFIVASLGGDVSHNGANREGIHHEACADAVYQARRIYKMLCWLDQRMP